MRRIYQDEMDQAEKELQKVLEEAERQKVGVVEVNLVAELEAKLSRVRAQLAQLQGSRPDPEVLCGPNVKRPCLSGQGRGGSHPCPFWFQQSKCVVVRTPFRSPRRTHQRRPCLCSRAQHNVVRIVNRTCRTVTRSGVFASTRWRSLEPRSRAALGD